MEERNSKYELQPSRNGLTVPVINDVYLHSIYNPTKEAQAFGTTHELTLKSKNNVLILGLGFGYHIEEIAKILNTHHKEYRIVILEPNQRLVNDFTSTRNFEDKNIKIICQQNTKDLFEDWNFIEFLMGKPSIIKHDTSFILEKQFYTNFLAFQAPKDIARYKRILSKESQLLFDNTNLRDFKNVVTEIHKSGNIESKKKYLLLSLNEIINSDRQGLQ